MASIEQYRFADLNARARLLGKISELETELGRELGEPVTLIAYTPREEEHGTDGCRAGLED